MFNVEPYQMIQTYPQDSGSGQWHYQIHYCPHCGGSHSGECHRIKAIEYHENGQIKRVEYKD